MSASERRRQRCLKAIENVLKFLQKDDSAHEITIRLQERFLSPNSILEANMTALAGDILRDSDAQFLSYIPSLTRAALSGRYPPHCRLTTMQAASDFLKPLYIGVPIEQFYLLLLDASGRLIECELMQKGTLDETPFYLGHMLQSVVTANASAVVLSHNHPGGTLRPSQADVKCTLDALAALFPLQISLLDHIIIADGDAVSIRDNGFISSDLWLHQDPKSKLLRDWLSCS